MSASMDIIITTKPPSIYAGSPIGSPDAKVLHNNNTATLLNLADSPKIRTKLQLYAILLALYVI
jgi:hypothetical protein